VAGVVGGYLFLSRISTPIAGLVAAFLLSVGPGFIYHSREFKPYALDLALTVWTFYAVVRLPQDRREEQDPLLVTILHVFSLSSLVFLFVFPASLAYRLHQNRQLTLCRLALFISPLLLFTLSYSLFLRPQVSQGNLGRFWAAYYANSMENTIFLAQAGASSIRQFFPLGWPVGVLGYFLALPFLSYRNHDGIWLLLLTPFFLHVLASALGLYPLFHRPSYYLYGVIVFAFAYVVATLSETLARGNSTRQRVIECCVFVVVCCYVFSSSIWKRDVALAMAWPNKQAREVFAALADQFKKGDLLRVNYGTYYSSLFYRDIAFSSNDALANLLPQRRLVLKDRTPQLLCDSFKEISSDIKMGDRVWFVTTHVVDAYKSYASLFPAIGDVRVVIGNPRQGLIVLDVTKPLSNLTCP